MSRSKKKKAYSKLKIVEEARRNAEIKEYGKMVSLRPGSTIKSKKDYKRVKKVEIPREDED